MSGNRIQAALYREVAYLIEQGVLSVADADDAVSWGPGLRWAVMGPSLQWHLGGGAGGIKHFMEHLMDPMGGMWKALGIRKSRPTSNGRLQKESFRRPEIVLWSNSRRKKTRCSWGFFVCVLSTANKR